MKITLPVGMRFRILRDLYSYGWSGSVTIVFAGSEVRLLEKYICESTDGIVPSLPSSIRFSFEITKVGPPSVNYSTDTASACIGHKTTWNSGIFYNGYSEPIKDTFNNPMESFARECTS